MRRKVFFAALVAVLVLTLPVQAVHASSLQQGGVHVVQRGENLTMIAARYGTTVDAIAQANGISNPNFIWVGQKLVIPGGGAAAPAAPAAPPAAAPPATSGSSTDGVYYHVVQPGENWRSIARRYALSVQVVVSANGGRMRALQTGEKLRIPGVWAAAAAAPAAPPVAAQTAVPAAGRPCWSSSEERWIQHGHQSAFAVQRGLVCEDGRWTEGVPVAGEGPAEEVPFLGEFPSWDAVQKGIDEWVRSHPNEIKFVVGVGGAYFLLTRGAPILNAAIGTTAAAVALPGAVLTGVGKFLVAHPAAAVAVLVIAGILVLGYLLTR